MSLVPKTVRIFSRTGYPALRTDRYFRTTISIPRPTPRYNFRLYPLRPFTVSSITTMPRTAETTGFKFNHTMIRVKDPQVSLKFYTEVLGMDLLDTTKFDSFTLYFLGYDNSDGKLTDKEKATGRFDREGVLELTHNHGTESDANFQGYSSGNSDPGRGFGHIAITVPDIQKACERFESLGVPFKKRLTDGTMKNIAFILDPDGYWVEVVPARLSL